MSIKICTMGIDVNDYRKKKLAIKLNMVRQIVSKCQNGLSIPNSFILIFLIAKVKMVR